MVASYHTNRGRGFDSGLVSITLSVFSLVPGIGETTPYSTVTPTLRTYDTSLQNKIAFWSDRDGGHNTEIYVMDLDGKNSKRLTNNNKPDSGPSISPDGTNVLFYREQSDTKWDIIRHNGDREETVLKGSERNLTSPQGWSPDGTKIAYTSDREDGILRIYITDPNFRSQRRLTEGPDKLPAWSPDGTKIAYIKMPKNLLGSKGKLHVIDLKTGKDRQITDTNDYITPAWITNEEIVVSEAQAGVAGCLTAIRIDTGAKRSITHPDGGTPGNPRGCFYDFYPFPFGKGKIIYTSYVERDGKTSFQISTINLNGTGFKILTDKLNNWAPSVIISRDVNQTSLRLEDYLFTETDIRGNGLLVFNPHVVRHDEVPGFDVIESFLNGYDRALYDVSNGESQEDHYNLFIPSHVARNIKRENEEFMKLKELKIVL